MMRVLPLAQWLVPERSDDVIVAWSAERDWTLGQLRCDVARLVERLSVHGGKRWLVCCENSYLFLVALLGLLHASKIPVLPGHRRPALLLEQQEWYDGILSDQAFPGNQSREWQNIPSIMVCSQDSLPLDVRTLPAVPDDGVIEVFTSGSTGVPRRIVKSVACMDREAAVICRHFDGGLDGCRLVASVPPEHLYGLTFRIFLPMAKGLPLHTDMLWYAEQLTVLDPGHRYVFISSPAFLKRLDNRLAVPKVSHVISAGGALSWEDAEQAGHWLNVIPDEIYGSSEAGVIASRRRLSADSAWSPFDGVEIHAVAEGWRLRSPWLDSSEGLILDDVLRFDGHDHFFLEGRRDRIVKIEENRVSLDEIENRLLQVDGIVEAAALPVVRNGCQRIGVLLVLSAQAYQRWLVAGQQQCESEWRRVLAAWVHALAVPRYWRVVAQIPVNEMGKRVQARLEDFFHVAY